MTQLSKAVNCSYFSINLSRWHLIRIKSKVLFCLTIQLTHPTTAHERHQHVSARYVCSMSRFITFPFHNTSEILHGVRRDYHTREEREDRNLFAIYNPAEYNWICEHGLSMISLVNVHKQPTAKCLTCDADDDVIIGWPGGSFLENHVKWLEIQIII